MTPEEAKRRAEEHAGNVTTLPTAKASTEPFAPEPLDYSKLIADGVPSTRHVLPPYLAAESHHLGVGPSSSAKSIWSLATSCELSREGLRVILISQENPLQVELSRLARLRPDPESFVLYHYSGWDLALAEHAAKLIEVSVDASLVVVDTWSACWSGDENDNSQVAAFDRDVVRPLIRETGASVLVLDHTGHAQPFVSRRGISAARGASAKGQKADVVLEFRSEGEHEFSITHSKNRPGGGVLEPRRQYRIEDDDETDELRLIPMETSEDRKAAEIANAVVDYVREAGRPVSTRELRDAMKGRAGRQVLEQALTVLEHEDPRRVESGKRSVTARDGKFRSAKAWWIAEVGLL